jgi:hypothetical protein
VDTILSLLSESNRPLEGKRATFETRVTFRTTAV